MKRVTASQARRNWFRLLDEVAAGAVIEIDRKGQRIVIRRELGRPRADVPSYSRLIRAVRGEDAHRWTWAWAAQGGLSLKQRRKR